VRGLRQDNTTAIKRRAAVIIENMAKLVDNPLDAVPFLPKLLPGEDAGMGVGGGGGGPRAEVDRGAGSKPCPPGC
jgi:hypothetical protein